MRFSSFAYGIVGLTSYRNILIINFKKHLLDKKKKLWYNNKMQKKEYLWTFQKFVKKLTQIVKN